MLKSGKEVQLYGQITKLTSGRNMIKNKQIKVVFLVDQFVFTDIESAKKFIAESTYESSEANIDIPSAKGRDE